MWRILIGLCLGLLLSLPTASAIRLPKPPTITKWDEAAMTQVNNWLESIWQLSNGRYTMEVTTTNPDGSRPGTRGDTVLFVSGTSWKLCANTTATTAASPTGKTWLCDPSVLTTP